MSSIRLILIQYKLYMKWDKSNGKDCEALRQTDCVYTSCTWLMPASSQAFIAAQEWKRVSKGRKSSTDPGFRRDERVLPIRDTRHLWFLLLSSLESSYHTFRKKESMAPLHLNFKKVCRELQSGLLHNLPIIPQLNLYPTEIPKTVTWTRHSKKIEDVDPSSVLHL